MYSIFITRGLVVKCYSVRLIVTTYAFEYLSTANIIVNVSFCLAGYVLSNVEGGRNGSQKMEGVEGGFCPEVGHHTLVNK